MILNYLKDKNGIVSNYLRRIIFDIKYCLESIFIKEDRSWEDTKKYFWDFIDDGFIHPIRYTWYGIQNLYTWFPIIFNDRNWDHYYLTVMLEKKLTLMANTIEKYGNHVDSATDVKRIRFCVKRIKELREDDFTKTLDKKHEEKYGKLKMFSFPFQKDENDKILTYSCEFLHTKVNPRNEELVNQERIDSKNKMEIGFRREERCRKLLFSCMNKYYKSWWD